MDTACFLTNTERRATAPNLGSVKVGIAYDTLCKFSADRRGPREVDRATKVLRDHVLWANDTSVFAPIYDRKPLPASEPIACDRTPFADDSAGDEQYSQLSHLQTFFFGCFVVTAFGSVYGSLMLLLPRRKRPQQNSENTTSSAETVGVA
jgi:hypothetical protein